MHQLGLVLTLVARLSICPGRQIVIAGLILSTLGLGVTVLLHGWVGEDAYITFRTIDQFLEGSGLRWNRDERVQTYTHPLWMFLNIVPYYFLSDINNSVTAVALVCTAAAYLLIGSRVCKIPFVLLIGFFLPLILSDSFVLYSTSGYENSLSHLCFAGFACLLLFGKKHRQVPWGLVSLTVALSLTNRLDTALVYLPTLVFLVLSHSRDVRWGRVLLGAMPIVAWMLFSLFYYGFAFPNTALAKLNEEVPRLEYCLQGLFYVYDFLEKDPVGFVTVCFALMLSIRRAGLVFREEVDRDSAIIACLGAGILFYSLYIVSIGGGFLSYRFWSLPVFIAATIVCHEIARLSVTIRRVWNSRSECDQGLIGSLRRGSWLTVSAAIGVIVAVLAANQLLDAGQIGKSAIILNFPTARWYIAKDLDWKMTLPARRLLQIGRRLSKHEVKVEEAIGMAGVMAGTKVLIVDTYALTDPLLARLPPVVNKVTKIGHFERKVPSGYVYARRTGSLDAMNPSLQGYYRPLRDIVSGPLLSWQRVKTLIAFNLGYYDPYLEEYVRTLNGRVR